MGMKSDIFDRLLRSRVFSDTSAQIQLISIKQIIRSWLSKQQRGQGRAQALFNELGSTFEYTLSFQCSLSVFSTCTWYGVRGIDSEDECFNFDCFPDVHPENLNIGRAEKIVGCRHLLADCKGGEVQWAV